MVSVHRVARLKLFIMALLFASETSCDWRINQESNKKLEHQDTQESGIEVLASEKCFCCSKNCQFQSNSSTLICNGVQRLGDEFLRQCSLSIVHLEIVNCTLKSIADLGLGNDSFTLPRLESFSLRNSSVERVDYLPSEELLLRVELSRNVNLSFVSWEIFSRTVKLNYLDVSFNKLEHIYMVDAFARLGTLNLSGKSVLKLWRNFSLPHVGRQQLGVRD